MICSLETLIYELILHIDLDHNNILSKVIDLSLQLVWLLKYFLVILCINFSILIKLKVWDI